jgi:hypothetical protein
MIGWRSRVGAPVTPGSCLPCPVTRLILHQKLNYLAFWKLLTYDLCYGTALRVGLVRERDVSCVSSDSLVGDDGSSSTASSADFLFF